MSNIAPMALFIITAIFHAAVAGFAFMRMRVRKSRDAAERAPFQPMDRQVTPESIVLDPRADSDAEDEEIVRHEPAVPEELIETVEPKRV
jgi:flagellar basal body-associated protein FliL